MLQYRLLPKRRAALLLATLPFALVAHPLAAQNYAVVQATPSPAQGELSRALQRLARNPGDFDALVEAGRASMALDDIDAAIGFYGRADVLRPGDPRVRAGLAVANLKSGKPIEALQLFDQAVAAGMLPGTIAADRGLAYDLVGDNASAQVQYRLALSAGKNDEIARRLGLSEAISGDEKAFEAALLPLLQRRDLAAYRARAFGLAILGKEDEAVAIVEAVMPRDLAGRMKPYLEYMPRLTRAQQAAAANLGSFPRAAQIGRDDPRFAAYAGNQPTVTARGADARLAPTGTPLGPATTTTARPSRRQTAAERRQATAQASRSSANRTSASTARAAPPPPPPPTAVVQAPLPETRPSRRSVVRAVTPPPPPAARSRVPEPAPIPIVLTPPPASAGVAQQAVPSPPPAPAPSTTRTSGGELPPVNIVLSPPTAAPPPPPPPTTSPPAVVVSQLPPPNTGPGFNLAQVTSAQRGEAAIPPVTGTPLARATPSAEPPVSIVLTPPPPSPPLPPPSPVEEPPSVADAFADLADASGAKAPTAGAVDITRIKPRLDLPPPPPPPPPQPPKPKVPSRVWVQVATGKDVKALAFDWRKFGKQAPALLGKRSAYTADWGQTRRLVTGPLDSAKAANQLVADLKKAGIDAFIFTSDEGEDVSPLK